MIGLGSDKKSTLCIQVHWSEDRAGQEASSLCVVMGTHQADLWSQNFRIFSDPRSRDTFYLGVVDVEAPFLEKLLLVFIYVWSVWTFRSWDQPCRIWLLISCAFASSCIFLRVNVKWVKCVSSVHLLIDCQEMKPFHWTTSSNQSIFKAAFSIYSSTCTYNVYCT